MTLCTVELGQEGAGRTNNRLGVYNLSIVGHSWIIIKGQSGTSRIDSSIRTVFCVFEDGAVGGLC